MNFKQAKHFKRTFNTELNGLKDLAKNHPWKKGQVPAKAFAKYSYAMRTLGVTDQNFYKEAITNKSNYAKQNVPKHLSKGLYPIIDSYNKTPSNPRKDLITPKKLYQKADKFQNNLPNYTVSNIKDRKYDNSLNMVDVHATSLKPTKYTKAYNKKHSNKANFKPAQHKGNQPKYYTDAASMSLKDMNKLSHLNHLNYNKSGQLAVAQRKYMQTALYRTAPKDYQVTRKNDNKQINTSNKLYKKYRKDYLNLRHNNPKKLATSTSPRGIARVTYRDKYNALLSRQNGITNYHKGIKNIHYNQSKAKELDQSPKLANRLNMYSGKQAKKKLTSRIKQLSNPKNMQIFKEYSDSHSNMVDTAKHDIKKYSIKRDLIEPTGVYTGQQLNSNSKYLKPLSTKALKSNLKVVGDLKKHNKMNKRYTRSVASKLEDRPKLAKKMNMYSGSQANRILFHNMVQIANNKNINDPTSNKIYKNYQAKISKLHLGGVYTGEQLSSQAPNNIKPLSAKAVKQDIKRFSKSQKSEIMPGHYFDSQKISGRNVPVTKRKKPQSGQSKKISPSILRGGHHPHF